MSAASLPDRRTVGLVAVEATWKVAAQPDVSSGSLLQQPLPRQPVAASHRRLRAVPSFSYFQTDPRLMQIAVAPRLCKRAITRLEAQLYQ
jgi:hypothetical protein